MAYECYICKKSIPRKLIPKEARNKISLQIFWHKECLRKQELENKK